MLICYLDIIVEWYILFVDIILLHWKFTYLSMPKILAGCHYNEEKISRHLKIYIRYWPVQINDNKFTTGQILKKTGRSCEGADFRWLSSKISRTLVIYS